MVCSQCTPIGPVHACCWTTSPVTEILHAWLRYICKISSRNESLNSFGIPFLVPYWYCMGAIPCSCERRHEDNDGVAIYEAQPIFTDDSTVLRKAHHEPSAEDRSDDTHVKVSIGKLQDETSTEAGSAQECDLSDSEDVIDDDYELATFVAAAIVASIISDVSDPDDKQCDCIRETNPQADQVCHRARILKKPYHRKVRF